VKDVDLTTWAVTVRSGKGDRDRITVLPERLVEPLEAQRRRIERLWREDLRDESFGVEVPNALARKLPSSPRALVWYWLFPATRAYRDRRTGRPSRHHIHESVVQKEGHPKSGGRVS